MGWFAQIFSIRVPLAIYRVSEISIRLGLNSGEVGSNNILTYVMIASAKVRRNEWC